MVLQLMGLVNQVVRVHANAVAAYEPRIELEEVPLGACGFQDIKRVDSHTAE